MPQSILIQVGQCGNQVGFQFWNQILKEYAAYRDNLNEEDIGYFFKERNAAKENFEECYSARAVLIDMEEGVIREGIRNTLPGFFPAKQIVTDVSGSGNNWAKGYICYGQAHREKIENIIRQQVESSSKLEAFLFTFSMGGGTGSGLGTAVLEITKELFPHIPRIVFPVYPSYIDDVITSPYNAVLANKKLLESADLIVPFDNQALINICTSIDKMKSKFHLRGKQSVEARAKKTKTSSSSSTAELPFNDMNSLISSVISDMTSCSRLPGTLNIDLNELVMNLTPFPQVKYAVPSSSPFILVPEDSKLERVFSDLFTPSHALSVCDVNNGILISNAILGRGKVTVNEIQNNLNKCTANLKFLEGSSSSMKIGLCNYAPAGRHVSLLKVSNTCQMAENLEMLKDTFQKMYKKKAHLHHYVGENVGDSEFSGALGNLTDVIQKYNDIKDSNASMEPPRLNLV